MGKKIVFDAKEIMLEKNVSKADIIRGTKLRPNTVGDYCAGKFYRLNMETVRKIMEYLGTEDFNKVLAWKEVNELDDSPVTVQDYEGPKNFSEKFAYIRKWSGKTLEDIGNTCGVSKQRVNQSIENEMHLKRFVDFVEAMGCTVTVSDKKGHSMVITREDFLENYNEDHSK